MEVARVEVAHVEGIEGTESATEDIEITGVDDEIRNPTEEPQRRAPKRKNKDGNLFVQINIYLHYQ